MYKLDELRIELQQLAKLKVILQSQLVSLDVDMGDVRQEIESELRIGYFI